ncbi:ribbon-helix-helix domain-containing protein [Bartonella sp. CB189]|uniref:ribbon-helix-helix domain-containing protein n=1 Tax=Bartonella sp. CB189 TaxID=3112254 RepID=UPI002F96C6AB
MHINSLIDWSKAVPKKISVRIDGHPTSVSLEQPFIEILKDIAHKKGQSLAFIITDIDRKKPPQIKLSASLRVYALQSILTQRL